MARPPIALTMGEPSGIGPEIALGAWDRLRGEVPFFLIGDGTHLPPGAKWIAIEDPREATEMTGEGLPVLPVAFPARPSPGTPAPENAQSVIDIIRFAVQLVQNGEASAVVTNPIHKKALVDGAGFAFPGHTEFLGALARVPRVVMMLAAPGLRVVPTTIHIPLSEVPRQLTQPLLEETIRITHDALRRDFGLSDPRIAVSGLNPHAGEGGVMGSEDAAVIAPVVARLRAEGFAVTGPMSADTMFHENARAAYDAAVLMYHDQALIPIKTLAFDDGVNVSLGLPFIRTSPDHGTALDIAGKGLANPASLVAAIRLADQMACARAVG